MSEPVAFSSAPKWLVTDKVWPVLRDWKLNHSGQSLPVSEQELFRPVLWRALGYHYFKPDSLVYDRVKPEPCRDDPDPGPEYHRKKFDRSTGDRKRAQALKEFNRIWSRDPELIDNLVQAMRSVEQKKSRSWGDRLNWFMVNGGVFVYATRDALLREMQRAHEAGDSKAYSDAEAALDDPSLDLYKLLGSDGTARDIHAINEALRRWVEAQGKKQADWRKHAAWLWPE